MEGASNPLNIRNQGRAIVENSEGGFLMMLPDGQVEWAPTREEIERRFRAWARRNRRATGADIGLMEVEWRTQ